MPTSQQTSLGIGIGIALAILVLVRKNQLTAAHSVWWLAVALASMVFGAYPQLIDRIGIVLGIHYPPTLLIVIGMGFILIKMLTLDLRSTRQERQIRALMQRMAVLEGDLYPEDRFRSGCMDGVSSRFPSMGDPSRNESIPSVADIPVADLIEEYPS